MNYCIHLKKRKNKPYCNIIRREIPFSRCRECDNKEYKTKNKNNTRYLQTTAENCRQPQSNNHQIEKKSTLKRKSPIKSGKLRSKSNKLAKLERNRKSVFTDDLEHCILCGKKKNDLHEIFGGRNRLNSIKYNLVLPLCRECHSLNQNNPFFNDHWHKIGQEYFECNIGSRNEFLKVFRRNYLK